MMKLLPIKALELRAKISPTRLSGLSITTKSKQFPTSRGCGKQSQELKGRMAEIKDNSS
jgi:hypothetical protein